MFEAPAGYTLLGGKQRDSMREEEEDLLQFAIQQSLLEAGSEYDQVGPRPGGEEEWSPALSPGSVVSSSSSSSSPTSYLLFCSAAR